MKTRGVLIVLLVVAGCSRKVEMKPVVVRPVVQEPTRDAKPGAPQAGIEFSDSAKQLRYEDLFMEFFDAFEPPARGSAQWLKLKDGQLIGGSVAVADARQITLLLAGGARSIASSEIDAASRTRLFATDFARARALSRMRGDLGVQSNPTPSMAATRYVMTDSLPVRIGPGFEFQHTEAMLGERGQAVNVIEELDGWLRLESRGEGQRWIPKLLTYPLEEAADPALKQDVEALKTMGMLQNLRFEMNEVDVEHAIWRGTDSQIRMGIARTLAAYCSATKSNGTILITVRDAATQRKLGKYSQSQGWKESL